MAEKKDKTEKKSIDNLKKKKVDGKKVKGGAISVDVSSSFCQLSGTNCVGGGG